MTLYLVCNLIKGEMRLSLLSRKYVPFYTNPESNEKVYYEYWNKQFYTNLQRKEKPTIIIASCFLAIFWFVFFKDITVYMLEGNQNGGRLMQVFMSFFGSLFGISILLSNVLVMEAITQRKAKKVETPKATELLTWIEEGKKSFKLSLFILGVLFLSNVLIAVLLYAFPHNFMLFMSNTILGIVFFMKLRYARPLERSFLYWMMKKEIKNDKKYIL